MTSKNAFHGEKNLYRAVGLGMIVALVLGVSAGCAPVEAQPLGSKILGGHVTPAPEDFAQDLAELKSFMGGIIDVHSVITIESESTEHDEVRITIEPAWIPADSTPSELTLAETYCSRPSLLRHRCILELLGIDGSHLVLDVSGPSLAELESEIAYSRALAEIAGGPITLKLEPIYEREIDGPTHDRFVGVNGCEVIKGAYITEGPCNQVVDLDALERVTAPSVAPTTWEVGRLVAHDAFPSEEVTTLLKKTNAFVVYGNLGKFSFADHATIEWFGSTETFGQTVWASDYLGSHQFSETRPWSKVLTALEWTIQTPGSSSFGYYASYNYEYEGGTIHFGTCEASVPATPGDQAFYDAVIAEGIALPSGSGAGVCAGGIGLDLRPMRSVPVHR